MKRLSILFLVAWSIFAVLLRSRDLLPGDGPVWLPHAVLKTGLILVSLLAMALDRRRDFAGFGFRRPTGVRWRVVVGAGLLLGMASTTILWLSPAAGMQKLFEGYGFAGIVLWVWLYSSLSEEIFVRGWFQTLAAGDRAPDACGRAEIASAVLFGSMHLTLLLRDVDVLTVVIIVISTTTLGWFAARFRTASGSLLPPFVTHVSFNVGGVLAGILLTLWSMVTGGSVPRP